MHPALVTVLSVALARAVTKIFEVFEPRPQQEPIEQGKQQQEQQLVVMCPKCAQKLRASARRVDSQLRCPKCRSEFTLH